MTTLFYSIAGMLALLGISWLFTYLGIRRTNNFAKRLNNIRQLVIVSTITLSQLSTNKRNAIHDFAKIRQ